MKKLESSLTNMVCVLTCVAVLMGGVLAWVNHLTSGPIEAQKQLALESGIKAVMQADQLSVASTDTIRNTDAKVRSRCLSFITMRKELPFRVRRWASAAN